VSRHLIPRLDLTISTSEDTPLRCYVTVDEHTGDEAAHAIDTARRFMQEPGDAFAEAVWVRSHVTTVGCRRGGCWCLADGDGEIGSENGWDIREIRPTRGHVDSWQPAYSVEFGGAA
jgi:hypothetical protein